MQKEELLKLKKKNVAWKRRGEKRGNGTSAVDDADDVLCVEGENTLVVVVAPWSERGALLEHVLMGAEREREEKEDL